MKEEIEDLIEEKLGKNFDWIEIEEGLNTIYLLRSEEDEYVLKIFTNEKADRERFRAEPEIYEILNRRTEVPSPEIICKDIHSPEKELFYVMEKIEGESLEKYKKNLSKDQLSGFITDFGEILGEIHNKIDFDEYGLLSDSGNGLETMEEEDSWSELLENWFETALEIIRDEWEQTPEIEEKGLRKRLENLPDPEPVLLHLDNRLENLLIEEDQITGLIDWGYCGAGDRYFDLVRAEYLLLDWDLKSRDPKVREELREKILEGYRKSGKFEREKYRDRRDIYRYMTVLWLMAGFPNWSSEWDRETKERFRNDLVGRLEKEKP